MKKWITHPATLFFFLFIFTFTALDMTAPHQSHSELENRPLAQKPTFHLDTLLSNEYTPKYEEYVNDQFFLRSGWIDIKSRSEFLLGKLENNNVVYGKDGYQFTKMFRADQEQYLKNVTMINRFAEKHPGLVTVMIVPSPYVPLADKLPAGAPFIDENACLDEIFSGLSGDVQVLDVRDVLYSHREEYIFYRTDHHWTTHGAYLAYQAYADLQGLSPFDPGSHTAVEVPDFYGTNFSKSKLFNTVPDVITYYDLPASVEINGTVTGLYDLPKFETRDKYAAFLYGNNGLTRVSGSGNGKCLVIKDSYANCFVPFLTENYAQIDVVDLRTMSQSVDELIEQEAYTDILILYNFQSFQSDNNLVKLVLN